MSTRGQDIFTDATARVLSWKRPLLLTHTKPDGDALGSLAAMRAMLGSQGIDALAVLFDPLPDRYNIFTRYEAMPVLRADIQTSDLSTVDGVIVLDTCAYNQLEPLADWLRAATMPKIAVDHHITRDDLAELYVVDESAAANCLILYDWARVADWPLDEQTRDALFVGIAMDTGWFRHSSTNSRVLAAAADLIQGGVRAHELVQRLFLQDTPGRVRLLGAALSRMELLIGDRVAIMTLPQEVFAQTGAKPADTEDIVNEPLRIASVVVSALLVDRGDGVVRASFRSKAPPLEHGFSTREGHQLETGDTHVPDVDVAAVAVEFGGGGHRRAAGARITSSLSEARQTVENNLRELFSHLA